MARGWGSKSVEDQIDSAESAKQKAQQHGKDLQEVAWIREKENLTLSRVRVLHELESAQNPRYQILLKKGLADLDAKLSRLDQTSSPRIKSS